jgi:hypothetical protein
MIDYPAIKATIAQRFNVTRPIFNQEIEAGGRPVLMKGLVTRWPAVQAALRSENEIGLYLKRLDSGSPVDTYFGPPEMLGSYFYNDLLTGFNIEQGKATLSKIVDQLLKLMDAGPPVNIYAGSTPASSAVPGFSKSNIMPLLDAAIEPRLWLGNRSRIAAHYDASRNIACCVSGRRRVVLFPPEQIGNLYVGPLEFTMAGPPASMVDFNNPDYDKYRRLREAEEVVVIADSEPSDTLYMPTLWWHQVEADGPSTFWPIFGGWRQML